MIIGVPKEIKDNEDRVGLTPAGVKELIKSGHQVYVQTTAGEGSGISDEQYETSGAQILPDIATIYQNAEMVVKVKEPIEAEYARVDSGPESNREPADGQSEYAARCTARALHETVTPDPMASTRRNV